MVVQIISANERLNEQRGFKIAIIGPPGIGKTHLVKTLDEESIASTVFVDFDSGDINVRDLPMLTLRPDDWPAARDLAVAIAGPSKSFAPTMPYSPAHYAAVKDSLPDFSRYNIIFIDGVTAASRLSFRHAEQQPENVSERTGRKDVRNVFGSHAREMILWVNHFQRARGKTVVFTGILERHVDELNVATWQLQAEGARFSREFLAVVDEVITFQHLSFGDGKPPLRGFVCSPNAWGYPAKDRSGKLDLIEPPDLGKLLVKLTSKKDSNP
jgi:hypothetical protein